METSYLDNYQPDDVGCIGQSHGRSRHVSDANSDQLLLGNDNPQRSHRSRCTIKNDFNPEQRYKERVRQRRHAPSRQGPTNFQETNSFEIQSSRSESELSVGKKTGRSCCRSISEPYEQKNNNAVYILPLFIANFCDKNQCFKQLTF